MKKYLNADGQRERIIPMWCDATWMRKLWCLWHGHNDAPTVTIQQRNNTTRTTCGICQKVLFDNTISKVLNPNDKNLLWNDEPVTWSEFCDRLEGKL